MLVALPPLSELSHYSYLLYNTLSEYVFKISISASILI